MKTTRILLFTALAMMMVACGGKEDDKAAKEKELAELKAEKKEIDARIAALEEELGKNAPVSKAVQVAVDSVETDTFKHFITVQGKIQSDNNVMVSPKTQGVITQIYVKEGQKVGKGQKLAQIDASVLQSTIAELETSLELAKTAYQKQKNLWDQGIGTEMQYLQAKNQKEALEKRIATLREQMGMATITAPISGVVDEVMAKSGEAAIPGMGAFRIVNFNDMSFEAELSEKYIPFISQGDKVSIFFPTLNKTLDAKVSSVSQTINPINRTISIRADLPSGQKDLKANMIGEITINDMAADSAIVLPADVIRKSQSGDYVFTAMKSSSGKYIAVKTPVTTGLTWKNQVHVKSGLRPGDVVIISNVQNLSDGQPVNF